MSLPRRVLPHQTYLITRRCLGRRFLLRPDDALTNAFLYCLALAAHRHGVAVHALCAMSNHYHLVITDNEGVLPDFMAWFNRQLAMCVKRLRRWDEVVWEPNVAYSAVELGGPSEVLDKVAYVFLNPVSAALVRSPERWPGALSTAQILRSGKMSAKRPDVWFKNDAPESVRLTLSAPPCFSDQAGYVQALDALVTSRMSQLRTELRRQGRGYLGRTRVRKTVVTDQPTTKKQRFGRNPTFSALTRAAWPRRGPAAPRLPPGLSRGLPGVAQRRANRRVPRGHLVGRSVCWRRCGYLATPAPGLDLSAALFKERETQLQPAHGRPHRRRLPETRSASETS